VGCGRPGLTAHWTDPNTSWWGPILNGGWPGPAGMVSIGRIVPSAAVIVTPSNPGFVEHGAEPVNCTTNVVVKKPPLVEVVRALLGRSRNSPMHPLRLAGAGGGAAAGARSATDRIPAGFHGTVTAVNVVAGRVTLVPLAVRIDDVVLVTGGADVLTAEGSGAGAAHPAAVISSNTPTSATKFARTLITSRNVRMETSAVDGAHSRTGCILNRTTGRVIGLVTLFHLAVAVSSKLDG